MHGATMRFIAIDDVGWRDVDWIDLAHERDRWWAVCE